MAMRSGVGTGELKVMGSGEGSSDSVLYTDMAGVAVRSPIL